MFWENLRNVMGNYAGQFSNCYGQNLRSTLLYSQGHVFELWKKKYCWLLWLPVYWLGELDFKKIKGVNKEKIKINTAIKVHCCVIQL